MDLGKIGMADVDWIGLSLRLSYQTSVDRKLQEYRQG
jgi:hypothetical protein